MSALQVVAADSSSPFDWLRWTVEASLEAARAHVLRGSVREAEAYIQHAVQTAQKVQSVVVAWG